MILNNCYENYFCCQDCLIIIVVSASGWRLAKPGVTLTHPIFFAPAHINDGCHDGGYSTHTIICELWILGCNIRQWQSSVLKGIWFWNYGFRTNTRDARAELLGHGAGRCGAKKCVNQLICEWGKYLSDKIGSFLVIAFRISMDWNQLCPAVPRRTQVLVISTGRGRAKPPFCGVGRGIRGINRHKTGDHLLNCPVVSCSSGLNGRMGLRASLSYDWKWKWDEPLVNFDRRSF